jgi:hypothetical protein
LAERSTPWVIQLLPPNEAIEERKMSELKCLAFGIDNALKRI